jgi:hypothetical protein
MFHMHRFSSSEAGTSMAEQGRAEQAGKVRSKDAKAWWNFWN